ncbi:MAG: CBS domain-containing protein [Methanomicrobiales archaeon]|nr:CBS domain-containing protein [Methanomicrobiales archaeon]
MKISEASRSEVVSAQPDARVSEIVRMMKDRNVGSVVITDQNRPVGIITDRDVLLRIVAEKRDPEAVAVSEVMTRDPMVFPADISVHEAVQKMENKWFRRIPIVDGNGRLTGIVSIDDLMGLLIREMASIASIVRKQMPSF